MIRQVNVFAIAFMVCIVIADSFADGLHPVPESQYGEVKKQLQHSKMERFFREANIQILDILSATVETNNGKNYNILSTISINGRSKKCCFNAHNFFPRQDGYFIIKAKVDAKKC